MRIFNLIDCLQLKMGIYHIKLCMKPASLIWMIPKDSDLLLFVTVKVKQKKTCLETSYLI